MQRSQGIQDGRAPNRTIQHQHQMYTLCITSNFNTLPLLLTQCNLVIESLVSNEALINDSLRSLTLFNLKYYIYNYLSFTRMNNFHWNGNDENNEGLERFCCKSHMIFKSNGICSFL